MYATVYDVERFNPQRAPFSSTTKPTASQVIGLIDDAVAEVHSVLYRVGYDVPIASSASLAYAEVKTAVSKVAAYLVEEVAPASGPGDRRNHYARMRDQAIAMLKMGELPDVAKRSDARVRYDTSAATAYFTRDMEL